MKEQWISSKVVKISDFWILSGWIKKYKPVLSKLDSFCDDLFCVKLLIVLLAVNTGKLQHLVSEGNFFCWVYYDFCSDLILYDIKDFSRIFKSLVENCLDINFSDILSCFELYWNSLWRLLMGVRKRLLQNDEASLIEKFGSLKIRNFGYIPNCLQLLRKSMSSFSLSFLYSSFSYLQKSLSVTFPYFRAQSVMITMINSVIIAL